MKTRKFDGSPVPPKLWGHDHLSTLVYIEDRCVNGDGQPFSAHMRRWTGRPARGKGSANYMEGDNPTRLSNGTKLSDHDDWDCAEDLVAAGLVEGAEIERLRNVAVCADVFRGAVAAEGPEAVLAAHDLDDALDALHPGDLGGNDG